MNRTIIDELGNTFEQRYCNYFRGENVTDQVTQAYWQCLKLTKNRLDRKKIELDLNIQKRGITNQEIKQEGSFLVGYYNSDVNAEKVYKADGRILHTSREHMKSRCNVIATDATAENVSCPNCGAVGSLESYIDGCDYCGSKFKVDDFKEKVSAFLLEENTAGIAKKNTNGAMLTFGVGFFMLIAIFILSIFLVILSAKRKSMYMGETIGAVGFTVVFSVIKPFFWCMFVFFIVLLFIVILYANRNKSRVYSEIGLASIKIDGKAFSCEKFAENVETIMKTVHFADRKEEVNAFSHIDLSPLLDRYQNVIECNLNSSVLNNYHEQNEVQYIELKTKLSLTSLINKKVKESQEIVYITLSRKKNIKRADLSLLHHYSCPNCGSSFDIMGGGVCEHCGTRIDMTEFGWMIERYHSNISANQEQKSKNIPLIIGKRNILKPSIWLKGMVVLGYLVVVLVCGVSIANNKILDLSVLSYYDDAIRELNVYFDQIPKVEDICDGVTLKDSDVGMNDRTYKYVCEDDIDIILEAYSNKLFDEGFQKTVVEVNEEVFTDEFSNCEVYIKNNGGYAGNTYVKLSTEGNILRVDMKLDDMDEDAWIEHINSENKK